MQRTCLHTMLDGHRCGCVALSGKTYCYFHARYYQHNARLSDPDYEPPIFEDTRSILLGIRDIVQAYMRGQLDQKQTTTLLYAYQIAMSGVHRPDAMSPYALEQHELRVVAQAQAKNRARAEREKAEEDESYDPPLAEYLTDQLLEMSDFKLEDLPPEQRKTPEDTLFNLFRAMQVRPGENAELFSGFDDNEKKS